MNHLMVDLEIMIALAITTYMLDLDAYELHLEMKKSSTTLLINARVLHDTHDRDSSLFQNIFVYFY